MARVKRMWTVWDWLVNFLLLNGGHCFHGGVIQVFRCCDWQAALVQNPFGLVDIGSWQKQGNTITATLSVKNWPNEVETALPPAAMSNHSVWKTQSSFGGINAHDDRWVGLRVNSGKFNCWSESSFWCEQCHRGQRGFTDSVCMCSFWRKWGQVAGGAWYSWADEKHLESGRDTQRSGAARLYTLSWLPPGAALEAATHQP